MKRLATTLLLTAILAACGVQKNDPKAIAPLQVPDAVKATFHEKFPTVQDPEWKLKNDHNYEAEFTLQNVETAVKLDPAGKWLETEVAIPPAAVPQAVQKTVAAQFKDYQVIETQSLQKAGEAGLTYELHLDNGKEIVKAQFSPAGAILTQSAKPKK